MRKIERLDYSGYGSYHERKGVVNHSLLRIYQDDPVLFWDLFNDKIKEQEITDAMRFGTAVHSFFLTPREFLKTYNIMSKDAQRPKSANQEKMVKMILEGVSADVAYKKSYVANSNKVEDQKRMHELLKQLTPYINALKGNREILEHHESERIKRMDDNFNNHEGIQSIWHKDSKDAFNEIELMWKHPCGLTCKAKLDRLVVDYEKGEISIIDLKTSRDTPRQFAKTLEYDSSQYVQQLAFYNMGVRCTYDKFFDEVPGLGMKFKFYVVYMGSKTGNVYLYEIAHDTVTGWNNDRFVKIEETLRDINSFKIRNRTPELSRAGVDYFIGINSNI